MNGGASGIVVLAVASTRAASTAAGRTPDRSSVFDTNDHDPSLDTANVDSHTPSTHRPPVAVRDATNVAGADDMAPGDAATDGTAPVVGGDVPLPPDAHPPTNADAAATSTTSLTRVSMRQRSAGEERQPELPYRVVTVRVDQDDALPRAQGEPPTDDGQHDARRHERRQHMVTAVTR